MDAVHASFDTDDDLLLVRVEGHRTPKDARALWIRIAEELTRLGLERALIRCTMTGPFKTYELFRLGEFVAALSFDGKLPRKGRFAVVTADPASRTCNEFAAMVSSNRGQPGLKVFSDDHSARSWLKGDAPPAQHPSPVVRNACDPAPVAFEEATGLKWTDFADNRLFATSNPQVVT